MKQAKYRFQFGYLGNNGNIRALLNSEMISNMYMKRVLRRIYYRIRLFFFPDLTFYVNGLPNSNSNIQLKIGLIDISNGRGPDSKQIFYGTADENGEVHSKIPRKYKSRRLWLAISGGRAEVKSYKEEVEVGPFGIYFTPHLESDNNDDMKSRGFDADKEFYQGQEKINQKYREFRHRDKLSWVIVALSTWIWPIISLFYDWNLGSNLWENPPIYTNDVIMVLSTASLSWLLSERALGAH